MKRALEDKVLPCLPPSPPAPLQAARVLVLPNGAVWYRGGGGCPRKGLRSSCGGWTQGGVTGVLINCAGSCCHRDRAYLSPPFHPTVPFDQHRKLISPGMPGQGVHLTAE